MASPIVGTLLPFLYFSISVFLSMLALKSPQRYRAGLLMLLAYFGILAFRGIRDVSSSLLVADTLGLFLLIWLSHMACALCAEKYVLPRDDTMGWKAAYKMLFNARWINTNRQAPDILQHPQSEAEKEYHQESTGYFKKRKMSRGKFLRNRVLSVTTIYAINTMYHHVFLVPHPEYYQELSMSDVLPSKQTYIRRFPNVTGRETMVRSILVFHFLWSPWAVLTGIHDILAFAFVAATLDEPEDWPPLYGRLSETYTIRDFWGKFWHRLVYRSYTNCGTFLSWNVLGLDRKSIFGKLVINSTVFFLSGVVHALVTLQLGYSCGYWEDLHWFCLNFAAIFAESVVQGVLCEVLGEGARSRMMKKTLGYVWVFGFLFWSLPKSQFPKMRCSPQ
jgi:hypothetical protein